MGTQSNDQIEIYRGASLVSSGVIGATVTLIQLLRRNTAVQAADRQRLLDQLATLRRFRTSESLSDMGLKTMNYVIALYDLAETKIAQPKSYVAALAVAEAAARHLQKNFDRMAEELA